MAAIQVRDACPIALPRRDQISDAAAIAEIYNHYIATTIVTFEEDPVSAGTAASRVREIQDGGLPWLVAETGGTLAGYAYAAPWKNRPAYRHTVEISVYVEPRHVGSGIGSALYSHLLPALAARGVHAALAGIALPNPGSEALHRKFLFAPVARLREVGFKFGRWIDIEYWEIVFPVPAPGPAPGRGEDPHGGSR